MKARDVHEKLKGRVDPVLLEVIMKIAEEQHALGRAIPEMAKSFDSLANVLTQHTTIINGMGDSVKKMQKRIGDVKSVPTDDPLG